VKKNMRTLAISIGIIMGSTITATAQNIKIQQKKQGVQIKIKETPAKANHAKIQSGNTKIQINNNPSGTKVMIKNHPQKGKKK
jgi:hypothetical protein